jgi:hypothetical protein
VAKFTPYGVEKIIGEAVSINLEKARSLFPAIAGSLESPVGPFHMLVGMDHMRDAPKKQARKEGVALYQSEFSTMHLACGNMGGIAVEKKIVKSESRVLSCSSTVHCFTHQSSSRTRLWEQNSPAGVLLARIVKSVSFEWTACHSKKTPNMR